MDIEKTCAEINKTLTSLDIRTSAIELNTKYANEVRAELRDHLLEIEKVLMGNGEGKSVCTRLTIIERWIENQIWFQRLIVALLASEFIGLTFVLIRMAVLHEL